MNEVLQSHLDYIDEAVIIDDGSTDDTPYVCFEALKTIPLHLIRNKKSTFHYEAILRQQQWSATMATQPDWILNMDADERFASGAAPLLQHIVKQTRFDVISFRLYDMWSSTHFREDEYWQAHRRYYPFLVRNKSGRSNIWRETDQHCGRFPIEVYGEAAIRHPLRVKHFGWSLEEDRRLKYKRYKQLDPMGKYGWSEQYESILDSNPRLLEWSNEGEWNR